MSEELKTKYLYIGDIPFDAEQIKAWFKKYLANSIDEGISALISQLTVRIFPPDEDGDAAIVIFGEYGNAREMEDIYVLQKEITLREVINHTIRVHDNECLRALASELRELSENISKEIGDME